MLNKLNTNTLKESYILSNEEIKLSRQFIIENQNIMQKDFEESLSENKLLILINPIHVPIKENYILAMKAIVIMKENWAKRLDEFDNYFNITDNKLSDYHDKINKLKKEVDKQQKLDEKKQIH